MKETKTTELPFRLALRHEGNNWNAYVAKAGTMEGAVFVGSIAMGFVMQNEKRKKAFQQLMTDCMADAVEAALGQRPDMNVRSAPEHEKAGYS